MTQEETEALVAFVKSRCSGHRGGFRAIPLVMSETT